MKKIKLIKELKEFILLWGSQSISSLGSAMTKYALIIWVYTKTGSVLNLSLMALCSYLPSVVFSFIAGAIADNWSKKKILIWSDLLAAIGTLVVLVLYNSSKLMIWHLYLVNIVLSFLDAFQSPASIVATTIITPKQYYNNISGMQSFSGSLTTILTPIIATAVLAFCGLNVIFVLDIITFLIALIFLLFFIKIPETVKEYSTNIKRIIKDSIDGIRYIVDFKPMFSIILFMSIVNLLESVTGMNLIPAMLLARTGNDEMILGIVSTCKGIGVLIGSILVTFSKPAKSRTKAVFLSCVIAYIICDPLLAVGNNVYVWSAAVLLGYISVPFITANMTTLMRVKIPLEMQGRVFSARNSLQYITIPLGLYLSGVLADNVFEPMMMSSSPIQVFFSSIVGNGAGAGMAVMFLFTGIIGVTICVINLFSKRYKALD